MTRPSNVPQNATAIPPSQMTPGGFVGPEGLTRIAPGSPFDPQYLAVKQFENTLASINSRSNGVYLRAFSDWQQNAVQDQAYGLPVPPAPAAPSQRVANVVYATADGAVQSAYGPGLWAYIWES